jgi:hypothetical protein
MRAAGTIALLAVIAATAAGGSARQTAAAAAPCDPSASAGYRAAVARAVASGRDVWGDELLDSRAGPTYAGARRLAPLLFAVQRGGRPLTASGVYYLPLSFPFTSYGSTVYALHVADGSEIITRYIDGPHLTIYVGYGRERYGSCKARLRPARLASGYLPIMETSYVDAHGVRYQQESFVGRAYGTYGARSVISFVRLTIDATQATGGAVVRLAPSQRLAHSAPDRLTRHGQTRLIVSDGARFVDGVARYAVPRGETATIYAEWLNAPSPATYLQATPDAYDEARATVVNFWQEKLDDGTPFDVPEPVVKNAELATLWQQIAYGWRYSVGNVYEELSYAESLDAAEVLAEYGYTTVARSVVELALHRMQIRPIRFTAFRGGHLLATAATYFQLTHDRAFVTKETGELARLVDMIAARQIRSDPARGRLHPEPLSTDLESVDVDSVPGQAEAIQGLLGVARMWGATGRSALAARARSLAFGIRAAFVPAVTRSLVITRNATVFVPDALSRRPHAFRRLTASKDGSYWNLVMPYAFASGLFRPRSPAANAVVGYLLTHGSRLLGVTRAYARTVYGTTRGSGLVNVYGVPWSRFFADNDRPDQLVLSLYGMLGASMTDGTFVSGEATSVVPVRGAYYRSMYMPPNSGGNASYLGTLRELLVHERRGPSGATVGLDLAFATPRAWLAEGKHIAVTSAPTGVGPVSYELDRHGSTITGDLTLPPDAHARLRLRVPAGQRLRAVRVNGAPVAFNRWLGTIDLGTRSGDVTVAATVTR